MKQQTEVRKNDILLGSLERPALQWLAAHMPAWVNSDTLTVIGILGSLLTLVSFIIVGRTGGPLRNYWVLIACLGFVINWFGDSLDGTLARYRHMERPNYGYFIDHSVDGFTALCMFLGFGFSGISRLDVTLFAAIGYLLMMITVFLKTKVTGVFEMTTIKLGPTEMRLIAILFSLVNYFIGVKNVELPLFGSQFYGTLTIGIIALILYVYYLVETVRVSIKLEKFDAERLAQRKEKEAKKLAKKQAKLMTKAGKKQRRLEEEMAQAQKKKKKKKHSVEKMPHTA
ncbi:MAG: CDP-alcohol phosphatidyltransferase family protein [Anaerolineaceae bacterium]